MGSRNFISLLYQIYKKLQEYNYVGKNDLFELIDVPSYMNEGHCPMILMKMIRTRPKIHLNRIVCLKSQSHRMKKLQKKQQALWLMLSKMSLMTMNRIVVMKPQKIKDILRCHPRIKMTKLTNKI
ncbi:uncharacterized protein LOC124444394 [Xenia sp. Carnegie-2017]|uniref:uncharacterized protein LOC124444394 n=1 Tax=Xenia sp. Carnegie-2017 TaxID=2897299 RepID=UPI001F03776F|nr:uncharacterized protein LOC124444394 [Xenia sp. Carnegie-2017]